MFQIPAVLSCALDALIVLSFFEGLENSGGITFIDSKEDPYFPYAVLSGLRIVVFIPFIWLYRGDRGAKYLSIPRLWLILNVIYLVWTTVSLFFFGTDDVYEYVLILQSFASIGLQHVCLTHLRSSILPERHIVLRIPDEITIPNTLIHSDEATPLLPNHCQIGDRRSRDQYSSGLSFPAEFVEAMHMSYVSAEKVWSDHVSKMNALIGAMKYSTETATRRRRSSTADEADLMMGRARSREKIFFTILDLFTGDLQGDAAIDELESLFRSCPAQMEQYVSLLTVYMLYAAFDWNMTIRSCLLSMCSRSLSLSHKLYWFIESFSLTGAGVTASGLTALKHIMHLVEDRGGVATVNRAVISNSNIAVNDGSVISRNVDDEPETFKSCIDFWKALTELSRSLAVLPASQRLEKLRSEAKEINSRFLPSHAIYAPIGRQTSHRIYSIVINECFAFSTKERAPMFLCLEIVEIGPERRFGGGGATTQMSSVPFASESAASAYSYAPSSLAAVSTQSNGVSGSSCSPQRERLNLGGLGWSVDSESSPCHGSSGDSASFTTSSQRPASSKKVDIRVDVISQMAADSIKDDESCSDEEFADSDNSYDIGQWGSPKQQAERYRTARKRADERLGRQSHWLLDAVAYLGLEVAQLWSPILDTRRENVDIESNESMLYVPFGSSTAEAPSHVALDDRQAQRSPALSTSGADESTEGLHPYRPQVVFKEAWSAKQDRLRPQSECSRFPGWRLVPVIIKCGDDLRQEQLASLMIREMDSILKSIPGLEYWLRPYDIIALSPDSGLIEAIPDTVSIDVLRKSLAGSAFETRPINGKHKVDAGAAATTAANSKTSNSKTSYSSLREFFLYFFGDEESEAYAIARENFVVSLASYCIVCHILALKDRHNGNILLNHNGRIIHIDFGFILGKSPGGNLGFENAPFKITSEFVDLMDGVHSSLFLRFREICVSTFMSLRMHHQRIVLLLEMLSKGCDHLPCFAGNSHRIIEELRLRFRPDLNDQAAVKYVHTLIDISINNWSTTCYDRYQRCFVGIF